MTTPPGASFNSSQLQSGPKKFKKIIIITSVVLVIIALYIGHGASREYRLNDRVQGLYALIDQEIPTGGQKEEGYSCDSRVIRKGGSRSCSYSIRIEYEADDAYDIERVSKIRQILTDAGWNDKSDSDNNLDLDTSFFLGTGCYMDGATYKGSTRTLYNGVTHTSEPEFRINLNCREEY